MYMLDMCPVFVIVKVLHNLVMWLHLTFTLDANG